MVTELEQLKECIEGGDSCIEAYEKVDLDQMRAEGNWAVASKIEMVLDMVGEINDAAGVE